jgi:hypothetical protein
MDVGYVNMIAVLLNSFDDVGSMNWQSSGVQRLTGTCGVDVPSDAATFFLVPPFGGLCKSANKSQDRERHTF